MQARNKGIVAIVASAFGFAVMATCVRLCDELGAPVSSVQKSFFRNLLAFAIALAVFRRETRKGGIAFPLSLWLRSALGTAGIFANFYALSHIPIADGQTLNKTAPFFTVLLARIFLDERLGIRQMLALAVAFGGTVLVAKPGFAADSAAWPLLAGVGGGICAGAAYTCLRKLALQRIDPAFVVLFFSAFSSLASVPFMLVRFDPMNWAQLAALFGAGVGAALGQFGITAAYRFAAPGEIAVFDYSNILFTAALGYVCFAQVPDRWSVLGMVLIVVAALVMRRRASHKA